MKLKTVLEAMYSTTQYWILPSGKVKKMRRGHEEYLTDTGMTYGQALRMVTFGWQLMTRTAHLLRSGAMTQRQRLKKH